jgi:hypothetical protein
MKIFKTIITCSIIVSSCLSLYGCANAIDSRYISSDTNITVKNGEYLKLTDCVLSPTD